ncbi:hypothetical protein MD484_g7730, partial [Candolleomyces efflorescens]
MPSKQEVLSYFRYHDASVRERHPEAFVEAPILTVGTSFEWDTAVIRRHGTFNSTIIQCLNDIVLPHSPPDISQITAGSPNALETVEFAIHCLFATENLLSSDRRDKKVALSLLPHWEAILLWVSYIVGELTEVFERDREEIRRLVRCCARVLGQIAAAGQWTPHLFRDARHIAGAVCSLWSYTDDNGVPLLISTGNSEGCCPVISLFKQWCRYNDTGEVLDQLRKFSGNPLQSIFQLSSARLKALCYRVNHWQVATGDAMRAVETIWKTMHNLVYRGPSEPYFDAMVRFKVFRRMVQSVKEITEQVRRLTSGIRTGRDMVEAQVIRGYGLKIMLEVMYAMVLSTDPPGAIAQGIYGGIYTYLIQHCLPHLPVEGHNHSAVLDIYKNICLHGVYADVRRAAVKAIEVPEGGFTHWKRQYPSFGHIFDMLEYAIERPRTSKQYAEYRTQLCDNVEHPVPKNPLSERNTQAAQVCTRCRRVIYCSKLCQSQDWMREEGHQKECKRFRQAQCTLNIHPSISERTELLVFIEEICNEAYIKTADLPCSAPSPDIVFVIDGTRPAIELRTVMGQTYWNKRVDGGDSIHKDQKERIRSFLNSAKADKTIKLAEGVFLYGRLILSLFVKLRFIPVLKSPKDQHFNIVSSVYSFLRPEE